MTSCNVEIQHQLHYRPSLFPHHSTGGIQPLKRLHRNLRNTPDGGCLANAEHPVPSHCNGYMGQDISDAKYYVMMRS